MDAPLNGVRILDFTWRWTGPTGTQLLAYLGADVIKVESRTRLDFMRQVADNMGKPAPSVEESPLFHDVNLNKMGVTLDLSRPQGRELAKGLVRISDVVAENFRPGVMARLGLDYASLRRVRPDLVMISVSTAGQEGLDSDLPGFATQFAALAGLMETTGYPDSPPTEIRAAMDTRVGFDLAFAVIAALIYRHETGLGQYIDLSAWEAQVCRNGDYLLEYARSGALRPRRGNRDEWMAPHNCYPCRGNDRWVSIAVASDGEFRKLCRAMGRPQLADDPRFADCLARWENQEELDRAIAAWTCHQDPTEATEALQALGVAAFPSMSSKDMFQDRHLQARHFAGPVRHAVMGERLVVGPPWKFSRTPPEPLRPAPMLGEHNSFVFRELLGLDAKTSLRLAEEGVLQ